MVRTILLLLTVYIVSSVSILSAAEPIPPIPPVERYVPKMGKSWPYAQRVTENGRLETLNSFQEECRIVAQENKKKKFEYEQDMKNYKQQQKIAHQN